MACSAVVRRNIYEHVGAGIGASLTERNNSQMSDTITD
jgi:hypothetical protein